MSKPSYCKQEDSMIIVTGDGKIIKNLDKAGVIRELQAAQARGDKYCSVTGAIQLGLDPFALEREAGYKCGATAKQCERSLGRSARKYLSTIGQRGGAAGTGDAKIRGDAEYYRNLRQRKFCQYQSRLHTPKIKSENWCVLKKEPKKKDFCRYVCTERKE